MTARSAPEGRYGAAGTSLWNQVAAVYELDPAEEMALGAACRTADEVARLEQALIECGVVVAGSKGQDRAHPLLAELRAHRLVLLRLLEAVGLDVDDVDRSFAKSHAGRQLAHQRWDRRGA